MSTIFKTIIYFIFCACVLLVGYSYWSMTQNWGLPTQGYLDEGCMVLIAISLLIIMPIIGIFFLFLIPNPQKLLPWIAVIALIWEPPIIHNSHMLPVSPIWNWIGLILSIILACIGITCLIRNIKMSRVGE